MSNRRKLSFLVRIVTLEVLKCLPQILITIKEGKRRRTQPFLTSRDVFVDGLRLVILKLSNREDTHKWIRCVTFENYSRNVVKIKE